MIRTVLSIYEYFRRRRALLWSGLVVLVAVLSASALGIRFDEDISAFVPKEGRSGRISDAYRHFATANRLVVSVRMADTAARTDLVAITGAVDRLAELVEQADSGGVYAGRIDYRIDQAQIAGLSQFLAGNMPYFLEEEDYGRLDTMLTGEYVHRVMAGNKRMLLSPAGIMVKESISSDPLHLAAPVLSRLGVFGAGNGYTLYDDHIFSADGREGIVTIESRFPASESRMNAELLRIVAEASARVSQESGGRIDAHYFGAADIAVTNAERIKRDTMLSMVVALGAIAALLVYRFRNWRSLALIVASLAFGGVAALGIMSLISGGVSLIAIGISSVIAGIAINYPLHFLDQYKHTPDVRGVIRNVVQPLTIGNITTVGAFLSLVFMSSEAMRDLGLFSSLMLAATIFFVLVFLPHMMVGRIGTGVSSGAGRMPAFSPDRNRWLVAGFVVCTVVLFFFSFGTRFDADMHSINYMTDRQREDMRKFSAAVEGGGRTVYYVCEAATLDGALTVYESARQVADSLRRQGTVLTVSGVGGFLPSESVQRERLDRWRRFVERKGDVLRSVDRAGIEAGFRPGAFSGFEAVVEAEHEVRDAGFFAPVMEALAGNYISGGDGHAMVAMLLRTQDSDLDALERGLEQVVPGTLAFDAGSLGRTMVDSLSDDFNRVLYICGLIVFVFLIATLGRIELALLAFLPLTIGWVWILGVMNIFDIRFNIVNIILATLIFGQGDDYTIFMTEGLMYEYTYRRRLLASYKNGIMLSAAIMLIGIGSLITARHPALRSLAEVTIVGMLSVVLTTFIVPPLLFRSLTMSGGRRRLMPVTLKNLASSVYAFMVFLAGSMFLTASGFVLLTLGGRSDRNKLRYHGLICAFSRFVVTHIPQVKTTFGNASGERFDRPAVIVCNHQSHLDLMCVMMLTPRLIVLTNDWVWNSPFYGRLIRYADFLPVSDGVEGSLESLRAMVGKGYSVVVFPEGTRSGDCSIGRFRRGAFYLAAQLGLDIVPVVLHGAGHVLPKEEFMLRRGEIRVEVMPRMGRKVMGDADTYSAHARRMRSLYTEWYARLSAEAETADYYSDLVLHNYIYKGSGVERSVRRNLRRRGNFSELIADLGKYRRVLVVGCGYGELPLLISLVHRGMEIVATDDDTDKLDLAANCTWAGGNLTYRATVDPAAEHFDAVVVATDADALLWKGSGAEVFALY